MFYDKNASFLLNQTSYITSEIYHALNQNSSDIHIIRSTSTLFYDLDLIAKRHSYHFVPQYPISERKIAKRNSEKSHKNIIFAAKSETIIQECATQIKSTPKRLDSLEIISKKMKKRSRNDNNNMLSSEIFLRDNDYTKSISDSIVNNENNHAQKFWSSAKYQKQYTNPIPAKKKSKMKDQGKRTEDPCPCQLFSYACPCTDKSLTELAKNRSLTVADQITSTPNFLPQEDNNNKYNQMKKSKCSANYEDEPTHRNVTEFPKKYEMTAVYQEPVTNNNDIPKLIEDKGQNRNKGLKNGKKWKVDLIRNLNQ
ncbi:uncharacterized protein LOC123868308 [Maniola jurtina]|uniref:uncharacterized protein LOC123868308 n=1 Tax=Maniola jurtina TaxID=191418 RepID=UPI001E68C0A4|nr:uncharacterized protein LOC123868308 [Maniola jurtina]